MGPRPDTGLREVGVADALRQWKSRAHPSPHWSTMRALIGVDSPRRAWSDVLQLRDGRHLLCRLEPLAGGATLVGFREAAAAQGHAAAPAITATAAPAMARAGAVETRSVAGMPGAKGSAA